MVPGRRGAPVGRLARRWRSPPAAADHAPTCGAGCRRPDVGFPFAPPHVARIRPPAAGREDPRDRVRLRMGPALPDPLARVVVAGARLRAPPPGAGLAPGRRPGSHRPPRRAGDIRRQPRQPPRRPLAPVSDSRPVAAPDVRRRRGRLFLRHPPQGDTSLLAQRRADRTPAGQPGVRQPPGRTAGRGLEPPHLSRRGAQPGRLGPTHRPGTAWLAVRTAARSCPVHVEGTRAHPGEGIPPDSRPGTSRVTFGRPLGPRPEATPAARRRAGAGRRSPGRRSGHRLVDSPAAGRGPDDSDSDRA